MDSKANSTRILWIDIFKALSITLVVLGHATGLFNMYIYQFHLAAFFFISGYVAKHDSDNITIVLFKKIYTLLLPTFLFILLNSAFMAWLNYTNHYEFWFGKLSYIGFHNIMEQFFKYGSIYTWLLGGAWFIIVLFIVSIMTKIIWNLSNKNISIYWGFTVLIYIWGYYCIYKFTPNWHYNFDLCMISQFFYSLGYIVKLKYNKKISIFHKKNTIILLLLTTICMIYCATIKNVAIDYTARSFHNIFLNTFTCINGIIWLYCLSILISQIHNRHFINILTTIGQNTLGILLLHFGLFKLTFFLLYITKNIPKSEFSNITPSHDTGVNFFWLFVLISILFSTIIWNLLKSNPILSFLIGTNKNVISSLEKQITHIINIVSTKCRSICNIKTKTTYKKTTRKLSLILLLSCYLATGVYWGDLLYLSYRPLDIWFPNEIENISFDGGWLDQSNENYRWIAKDGTITFHHNLHKKITIEGYVPEDFIEVSQLDIYVDGTKLKSIDTTKNAHFNETIDIKDSVKSNTFQIKFVFDGVHTPSSNSNDPRSLSGLISHIYLE